MRKYVDSVQKKSGEILFLMREEKKFIWLMLSNIKYGKNILDQTELMKMESVNINPLSKREFKELIMESLFNLLGKNK